MSKLDRGLPEWANYLLKALFVMIFPLTIYATEPLEILFLPTSGFLFAPTQVYPQYLVDLSFIFATLSIILRNFIIGIIVALPGIYYNYKLSRAPLHKSFWKRGIGLSAAIFFVAFGVGIFLSQYTSSLIPGYNQEYWELLMRLQYYPSLVMGVFIILPLVLRQAVTISVPSDLHYYSMRDIEASPKFNLSREKMLSAIFWLFICFAPYAIQYDMYSWYGGYMSTSLMMDYRLGSNWYGGIDVVYTYFFGQIAMFPNMPIFVLLYAFNFAFVRDVYRYLRNTITRSRLIGMAVFSCLFPLILSMGMGGLFIVGMYLIILPLPIPIIQIVGLVTVRYHHPEVIQSRRVWKGDRSAMWWETETTVQPMQTRAQTPTQTQATPEKPIRHRDEIITVPLRYRFLSRIRKLRLRNQTQHEEVF
ncbi:MAG: hypothetical protein RTV31_07015 [Candidatus Thorarchaeota archaeon]